MQLTNTFLKIALSASFALLLPPVLNTCSYEDPEGQRVWLFAPNTANLPDLLPFTYSYYRYYGATDYGYPADTAHYLTNVREWKAAAQDQPTEKDIHQVLYATDPADFKKGKPGRKNTLIKALEQPANAELKQYLAFAKNCEAVLNAPTWDAPKEASAMQNLRTQAQTLLDKAKTPFVKQRAAYQLLKISGYLRDKPAVMAVFEKNFSKTTDKSWILGSAMYHYAEALPSQSAEQASAYIKAWRNGSEQHYLIQRYFRGDAGAQVAAKIADPSEKALGMMLSALSHPGRALNLMKQVAQTDPTLPELSMLMAREVNKLENWLLTPQLTGGQTRFEYGYEDSIPPAAVLREADLRHLRECRDWVNTTIGSGKRPDPAFWLLTAAHLAYLDGDYPGARSFVAKAEKLPAVSPAQQVQLTLTDLVAEIAGNGQLAPATEEKIPALFQKIDAQKGNLPEAGNLKQQLALLLSHLYVQKGDIAKGCLMLGRTNRMWDNKYWWGNTPYDRMSQIARPADFEKILTIIQKPQTAFEKWLAVKPDLLAEETGEAPLSQTWNTDKILDFLGMYYVRQDQLDSALLAYQRISDNYWQETDEYDRFDYARVNPFSTGIELPGVALSVDSTSQYTPVTFLAKIIELQQAAAKDPALAQTNYFLIGNAYYNMTWHANRDWWIMNTTYWSVGDLYSSAPASEGTGAVEPRTHPFGLPPAEMLGLTLLGLLVIGGLRRPRQPWLLLAVVGSMAVFSLWNCKKMVPKSAIPPRLSLSQQEFNAYYLGCDRAKIWYEKALEANPKTEAAVASAFMAGRCAQHRAYFEHMAANKPEEDFKAPTNPYRNKVAGATFSSPVSCAYFQEFIQ